MNFLKGIMLYIVVVINIITFVIYGYDKFKAKIKGWRVSEFFLLTLGICGGALGGFAGMIVFHHKVRKIYFYIANFIGLVILNMIF